MPAKDVKPRAAITAKFARDAVCPDKLEENKAPATADVESLRGFLEGEVLPWFENRLKRASGGLQAMVKKREADIPVTASSGNVFADMHFAEPEEELTKARRCGLSI